MYVIKHDGFAMILAIFVVILVALGGVILLGNASIGSKSSGDNYIRTQAELLAQSATEYAVMRAQGFDTTAGHCLKNVIINAQDSSGAAAYDISVTLRYSFEGAAPASCVTADANLSDMTGNPTMILVDTVVTDHNLTTEPVRITKRTWQKL